MKLGKLNTEELAQRIEAADTKDTAKEIMASVQAVVDHEMKDVVAEYKASAQEVAADAQMAAKHNLRTLSKQETEFYNKLRDPKQIAGAFKTAEQEDVIPVTIMEQVFEDLRKDRPLFDHITWTPAGVKKFLLSEPVGVATWGKIDAEIVTQITADLENIQIDVNKLSAFAFIPNALFDIGVQWIDKYVREILLEAAAEGLEEGIVDGDGKNKPLGLTRKLSGDAEGAYPKKEAMAMANFGPEALGAAVNVLTENGKHKVGKMVLLVSAADRYTKVAAATTFLNAVGEYRTVFPFDVEVIDTVHLDAGEAVLYEPKTYVAGVTEMGVARSEHFQFLEDNIVYKVVTYGNGRLRKEHNAVLLDITALEPLAMNVNGLVTETPGA